MKVLFLGAQSGTSRHRADAFRRLGHDVVHVWPERGLPGNRLAAKFHYETGGLFADGRVARWIAACLPPEPFDVAWIDHGRFVGPRTLRLVQRKANRIACYNNDDPFGYRDRLSWLLFRRAVPYFDVLYVKRTPNIAEAEKYGARRVEFRYLTSDEVAHRPRAITPHIAASYGSEVLFLGTWMPERGPFLAKLVEDGVPLSIRGARWNRAREWPLLASVWRGGHTVDDDEYAYAIQCSRVCLGLLSKGNRDLHTRRSVEIPALGGLLCAERTSEHESMYLDGVEAAFWSTAEECADVCRSLLADEPRRAAIALAGVKRCEANGYTNEKLLAAALEAVTS